MCTVIRMRIDYSGLSRVWLKYSQNDTTRLTKSGNGRKRLEQVGTSKETLSETNGQGRNKLENVGTSMKNTNKSEHVGKSMNK